MKYLLFFLLAICVSNISWSQSPVAWLFSAKKIEQDKYEVHIKGVIDKSWHIYSVSTPVGGPAPTKVAFKTNPLIGFKGKLIEKGKIISRYESVFDKDVKFFEEEVEYIQVITMKASVKTNVGGTISYMACNDEKCMPVKSEKFNIPIP